MKPNGDYGPEYQRRVQRRNRLLKTYVQTHPEAEGIRGAARKVLLDQLEAEALRPRVWNWQFDHADGHQDRPAFELYKRAVKLRVAHLRAKRQHNTARMLEGHLNSLVDSAPRRAWCYYPAEWKEISRALRPQGSKPQHTAARLLYTIYQRIRATRTVEDQP